MSGIKAVVTDSLRKVVDTVATTIGFPYSSPTSEYGTSSGLFQEIITNDDLIEMYRRNPIAKVIVNDVVEDVFDKGFKVVSADSSLESKNTGISIIEYEDQESGKTEEDKLNEIDNKLNSEYNKFFEKNLRQMLIRTLKLARLRGYSLILIGYSDGLKLNEQPDTTSRITFFQPIDSDWIEEVVYETDENDNIVMPIKITGYKLKGDNVSDSILHPKRVIHVENPGIDLMGTGESALMPCFDDLVVLKHVTWGAGQTMWRSGNQMVTIIAPPRATDSQLKAIDAAMADVNAKSAFTFPYGTTVETHTPTGLNPAPYAEIPLNNISASTRIPLSVLIGSQAGTLSSSLTDQRDYAGTLSSIQNNVVSPILMEIFDRLQYSKQLSFASVKIAWNATLTMSEPERTLVEYREALTKRINMEVEQDMAETQESGSTLSTIMSSNANSEETLNGTYGIQEVAAI